MTSNKAKYCIQWESHSKQSFKGLCSLMEHQSLVDIVIVCGNNTLHAHKCILAASSSLFREEFEKNQSIEQVIVSGCDFVVIKAIIEIMYCGETLIFEDFFKYLAAAAKTFQMKGLENLFNDRNMSGEEVFIPRPQFLSKKPKYPTAFHPIAPNNILSHLNFNISDPYNQRRLKRRYVRSEAEKACAKEAQASRMALANLQKEIASAPQVNSFIIEETCTETTVENFIPHTDDLHDIQQQIQVGYNNIEPVYIPSGQFLTDSKPSMVQFQMHPTNGNNTNLTTDKIKNILGHDIPSNVEIMFKTNDGSFVSVTDDVLKNLAKGGLQYQVVDENGHVGEIQELQVLEKREKSDLESITDLSNNKLSSLDQKLDVDNITCINFNTFQNLSTDHKINLNELHGQFANSQFSLEDRKEIGDRTDEPDYICPSEVVNSTSNSISDGHFYKYNDHIFITDLTTHANSNESAKNISENASVKCSKSPVKDKSSNFSPDMFFADISTGEQIPNRIEAHK